MPSISPSPSAPRDQAQYGKDRSAKHSRSRQQQRPAAAVDAHPATNFDYDLPELLHRLADHCNLKTTVSIGNAQLQLLNHQANGRPPVPLGAVELSNLWLAYFATSKGNMFMSLSLPTIHVWDQRPGVAPEQSLVVSTAAVTTRGSSAPASTAPPSGSHSLGDQPGVEALNPSLLSLEYRAVRSLGSRSVQAIRTRLQQPTFVVDIGFITTVLGFAVPNLSTQESLVRPFQTRELHLSSEPHVAEGPLWLSPEYRLIADKPGVERFVYDGQQHPLILAKGIPTTETVPLIVVGRGKTLQLRNVRIGNVGSLAACLSLAPGAKLLAEEEDGVQVNSPSVGCLHISSEPLEVVLLPAIYVVSN